MELKAYHKLMGRGFDFHLQSNKINIKAHPKFGIPKSDHLIN